MDHHYDAIIVGGRCAGAATAMLLARGGLRVLVVESAKRGTDTLSTHALMRGGVLQLHRWGLLDAVIASGTPAIRATQFSYGDDIETVDIRRPDRVTRLLTSGGRVHGVEGITRGTGTPFRATATLTVGADGRGSTVARAVDAEFQRRGTASG